MNFEIQDGVETSSPKLGHPQQPDTAPLHVPARTVFGPIEGVAKQHW